MHLANFSIPARVGPACGWPPFNAFVASFIYVWQNLPGPEPV
jgi:hypothetical protein